MTHIIEASFSFRYFTEEDVERSISSMPNLQRLDISHNIINHPPSRLPKSLVSLNLSFNAKCKSLSGYLLNLHNLRELVITNNNMINTSGLSTLQSLEKLDISNNLLTKLNGLESLPKLRILICQNNKLKSIVNLRCLSFIKSVEVLDFRGNPVCDIDKYISIRNFISSTVGIIDGKRIKARSFEQLKKKRDRNTEIVGVGATGTGIGGMQTPLKMTRDLEQMSSNSSLVSSSQVNNETSFTGYTAQYLNSTRNKYVEGLQFSPIALQRDITLNSNNCRSPVQFVTPAYNKQHNESISVVSDDTTSTIYNGNGSPRSQTFRLAQSKTTESSKIKRMHPRYADMYIDDRTSGTNSNKNAVNNEKRNRFGSDEFSSSFHSHHDNQSKSNSNIKKSPLPWRNPPVIKPRPWKGLHWNDTCEDEEKWEAAATSSDPVPMLNNTPWVAATTVAAYERSVQNISNKILLKKKIMETKKTSEKPNQSISQQTKDHIRFTGSSPLKYGVEGVKSQISSNGNIYVDAMWIAVDHDHKEVNNSNLQLSDIKGQDFGERQRTKPSYYNYSANYHNVLGGPELELELGISNGHEILELSQLTNGSEMQPEQGNRIRAYYEDADDILDDRSKEPNFMQPTFAKAMHKSPVRTNDPRVSDFAPKRNASSTGTKKFQRDSIPHPIEFEEADAYLEYSIEENSDNSDESEIENKNAFFVHDITEPDASISSTQPKDVFLSPSTMQKSTKGYFQANRPVVVKQTFTKEDENDNDDNNDNMDEDKLNLVLEDLFNQKEEAFALLQDKLEKFLN
jgi:hypothetical protein